MEVKGRHVLEGKPTTVTLHDGQIREALGEPIRQIVQAVRDGLERIPPEIVGRRLRPRHRAERRRRAAAATSTHRAAPRNRSAGGSGRRSAVVGGARRRQMLSDFALLRKLSIDY